MKFASFDIVFQEIPDEVVLAINLTSCPIHCAGCHSPHLWQDTGTLLTDEVLDALMAQYATGITCVCLMGGDAAPEEVMLAAERIQRAGFRSAWYSGRKELPTVCRLEVLDYVKTGPYVAELGGLKSPKTNQRLYRVCHEEDNRLEDMTHRFWKK